MRARIFLLRALVLAGVAGALLWPALVNRGPFFNSDTRSYLRAADTAVNRLTHRATVWTAAESGPAAGSLQPNSGPAPLAASGGRTRSLQRIAKRGILLGRSPYYGLLVYTGTLAAGFWLPVLLQAAALLLAVYLALRALALPAWPHVAYLGLALCLVPAAPFFAGYLMPDLFAAIAILACAVLLSVRRLAVRDLLLWYLLLSVAMLFHESCTAIAAALLAFAVVVNLLRRSWNNRRGLAVILFGLLTAFAGQSLVNYGVKRATGEDALRLPFLSARLVADGPGTRYLRATCPASHFALCGYAHEFPMPDAAFLFGTAPGKSVFETASYRQRSALSKEQFRFFLAVFRYDPIGVLEDAARNAAVQLLDFRLATFHYGASMRGVMEQTFPLPVAERIRSSPAYRGTLPLGALSVALYAWVLGSLAYLIFVLAGNPRKPLVGGNLKRTIYWMIAGVAVNAGVCGAFSAVDPRYQARVVWLLPLAAFLAALEARRQTEQLPAREP